MKTRTINVNETLLILIGLHEKQIQAGTELDQSQICLGGLNVRVSYSLVKADSIMIKTELSSVWW